MQEQTESSHRAGFTERKAEDSERMAKRVKANENLAQEQAHSIGFPCLSTTKHTTSTSIELMNAIALEQSTDTTSIEIRSQLTSLGKTPTTSYPQVFLKRWKLQSNGLLSLDGRCFVPETDRLRTEILRRHHDDMLAGHLGTARTLESTKRSFMWPSIRRDTKDYCQTCKPCQQNKSSGTRLCVRRGKLHRPFPFKNPQKPRREQPPPAIHAIKVVIINQSQCEDISSDEQEEIWDPIMIHSHSNASV